MPVNRYTVHIIDPDVSIREGLSTLLSTIDIPAIGYDDAQKFLDFETPQDLEDGCILVEAKLRGLSCMEFLKRLRADNITLPVYVLVSTSQPAIADRALRAGATDIMEKPLLDGRFLERLQQLITPSSGLDAATT